MNCEKYVLQRIQDYLKLHNCDSCSHNKDCNMYKHKLSKLTIVFICSEYSPDWDKMEN